ncbi:YeeE/YedE family protein [Salipaludibacillus agaradhaerens]|uniref:YeeE/YedE family protein n=1 Tax=Salipaludibacillus agaradhaerens TaxID=76935 RepID=A0A9Q4FX33_SALAG|nr:YeeE/YedE family protein [Salipaludibacillus agaradhaerens]MCR6096465.1 YeeE/YedE family protein [Salipaludibacillus agaradhaerens]MCR6113976.1 YeeE/YedE family protein [Salipaludibacillus agaradhaerens]
MVSQATSREQRKVSLIPLPPMQTRPFFLGIGLFIMLLIISQLIAGTQMALLSGLGLLLGFTLFHARFGFTSAFRRLLTVGNGEAIRAHMVMLAVAVTLFAPILHFGVGFFGESPTGFVSPVGTSVIVGSFLFGIGMQLGNGCASGTLFSLGSGRSSMIIVLISFIIGSVFGAWHFEFWTETMPNWEGISLATHTGLGYFGAWTLQMLIFAFIFVLTYVISKRKKAPKMAPLPTATGLKRVIRGSWPILIAAVLLAVLNAATLMLRGQPWGITGAFALWGSKIAQFIGIDVASWGYWQGARASSLDQSIFFDSTSVMNFGLIIGAFMATTAGGLFSFKKKIPLKLILASVIGGLLMGYGARLAFGCNIGAYFGGIASFSVHGWIWMIFALLGSLLAIKCRPFFGLQNPKKEDTFC